MKKDNIKKAVYYYLKSRTASYNVGQYLNKLSDITLLECTCHDNMLDNVTYYLTQNTFSNYYYELRFTSSGITEHIHDGLQDLIS